MRRKHFFLKIVGLFSLHIFSQSAAALDVQPEDVAFLLPLPNSDQQYASLPGLKCSQDFSVSLLEETGFYSIIDESIQSFVDYSKSASTFDELIKLYEWDRPERNRTAVRTLPTWRLTGVRLDACRGRTTLASQPAAKPSCVAQIRLVLQPILNRQEVEASHNRMILKNGFRYFNMPYSDSKVEKIKTTHLSQKFWADDHSMHLIYDLQAVHKNQLVAFLEWIRLHRGEESGHKVPWIHPYSLTQEGLQEIKKEVAKLIRGVRLHHATTSFSSSALRVGGEWYFNKLKKTNSGEFKRLKINVTPKRDSGFRLEAPIELSQVLFHLHEAVSSFPYIEGMKSDHPDSVVSLLAPPKVNRANYSVLLEKYKTITDWQTHTQNSVDCVSCHSSTSVIKQIFPDISKFNDHIETWGLDQALTQSLKAAIPFYPVYFGYNVRQFAYFMEMPAVSLRTIREAHSSADYFSKNF